MKRIVMIIMGGALMTISVLAQQEVWQSTSVMTGSGSAYSSQVTAVGAASAADMGTSTTESYAPGRPGQVRRGFDTGGETGRSEEYPIGDAVLPLMGMAMLFAGAVFLRRKKALNR